MKTQYINRITLLLILIFGWFTVSAQQQPDVPGDNFSLEGALELFKKSASPEEFERMLNDPDTRVNNLDLDGDGYIDYIRVVDMFEQNVHVFVMQAAITETQSQDIAVITLEKLENGKAVLQITGDADIYGVETIIEPTTEVRTYAGTNTSNVIVNVWAWPLVRYVYGPYYRVWISPWGWSYRPAWWSPWRPVVYYDYYSYWGPYRRYYSLCYSHRIVYAHHIYWPHRRTSVIVYKRHYDRIHEYRTAHIDRRGNYQPRADRYPNRRTNNVRYNTDGRIASASRGSNDSRSYSGRNATQGRTPVRRESGNTDQRSIMNSRRSSENYYSRQGTERSGNGSNLRMSENNSNVQRSSGRSAGNANKRISGGNQGSRRSDINSGNGSNDRRSGGTSAIQRSSRGSSGNSAVRPPQQRSGSNQAIRSRSGSSNSRQSIGRSSGNSGARISSGNSGSRSSGGSRSSVQRSSSRSSSGRSSGSSNSRSSGSSGRSSRGRH